jgi:hypothetical protein
MKRSWTWRDVLPTGAALTLRNVVTTADEVVVEAEGQGSACCPGCGQRSQARHSRYWRTLKDVAAHGRSVQLRVRVSRWRCHNPQCDTAIFAERLPGVAALHARHTDRFGHVVHLIGHALGGRAGERLLMQLSFVIGADTIVRLVKRGAPPATADATVRVVGIDDWAWQKGQQHFGTILVDLERRRVVDVLAVSTADVVADWLTAHPTIRIISRDRHGPYADAVRRGAPQAREVADRFHLVSNLRDAVQHELERQRRFLVVAHRPTPRVLVHGQVAASRLVRRTPSVEQPLNRFCRIFGAGRLSGIRWIDETILVVARCAAQRSGIDAVSRVCNRGRHAGRGRRRRGGPLSSLRSVVTGAPPSVLAHAEGCGGARTHRHAPRTGQSLAVPQRPL